MEFLFCPDRTFSIIYKYSDAFRCFNHAILHTSEFNILVISASLKCFSVSVYLFIINIFENLCPLLKATIFLPPLSVFYRYFPLSFAFYQWTSARAHVAS